MPGTRITDQRMRSYLQSRRTHTRALAAARAGSSERPARRIKRDPRLPSRKAAGPHRGGDATRGAGRAVRAGEVPPLLEAMPALRPITVLEELEEIAEGASA